MSEKKPKTKKKCEVSINCPYCQKGIIVKVTEKIIIPAEPATKEEIVDVTKDTQTRLND